MSSKIFSKCIPFARHLVICCVKKKTTSLKTFIILFTRTNAHTCMKKLSQHLLNYKSQSLEGLSAFSGEIHYRRLHKECST